VLEGSPVLFHFLLEVAFGGEKTVSIALVKKHPEGVLENSSKTVASQIQIIHLGEDSPFDTLHNYIHNSFGPFLRSYLKTQKEAEKIGMYFEILRLTFC
jgi:dynein heavy chain 1